MQELIFDKPVGLELELEVESIYGVKIPKIQPPTFGKELPFSPIGAGTRTLEAATQFQNLVEAITRQKINCDGLVRKSRKPRGGSMRSSKS